MTLTEIDRDVLNQLKSLLLAKHAGRAYDRDQLRRISNDYQIEAPELDALLQQALQDKQRATDAKQPVFSGDGVIVMRPRKGDQLCIGFSPTDGARRIQNVWDFLRPDQPRVVPDLYVTRWYPTPGEDERTFDWCCETLKSLYLGEIKPSSSSRPTFIIAKRGDHAAPHGAAVIVLEDHRRGMGIDTRQLQFIRLPSQSEAEFNALVEQTNKLG